MMSPVMTDGDPVRSLWGTQDLKLIWVVWDSCLDSEATDADMDMSTPVERRHSMRRLGCCQLLVEFYDILNDKRSFPD